MSNLGEAIELAKMALFMKTHRVGYKFEILNDCEYDGVICEIRDSAGELVREGSCAATGSQAIATAVEEYVNA